MRAKQVVMLALTGVVVLSAGCKKNSVDKSAFKSAINNYYSSRQDCLWSSTIKFPAQVDASNDEQTRGFDALTDAGMLSRMAAEKKRFLIGSKQVTDYDLTDKGRATWTADQTQPGYGNFCYGHSEVSAIDSYSPADNPDALQFSVSYHYGVNLPSWANTTEMKTAFPNVGADSSGQETAIASLNKSNDGWLVGSVRPTPEGGTPPPQP